MKLKKQAKKQKGFTLLEMMMVIAILAILTMISIPYYGRMVKKAALRDMSNRWLNSYHLAQTQAMRLQKRVVICASNDGLNCTDNTEFTSGWLVGYCEKDTFKVIQDNPPLNHGKIEADFSTANNLVSNCDGNSSNDIKGIQFLTNGRLPLSFRGGSMTFSDPKSGMKEKLVMRISSTGRIESELTK